MNDLKAGRGYLRSVKSEGDAVLDLVPVDIVVNLLITSAWYTATNRINRIQIYHCSTGKLNPFRWGEMGILFLAVYWRYSNYDINILLG